MSIEWQKNIATNSISPATFNKQTEMEKNTKLIFKHMLREKM